MEVRFYIDERNRRPVQDWIDSLNDQRTRAKIKSGIGKLRVGILGRCKSVGEGVHELKIDFGPGYRIYFGSVGDTLILLLKGGTKKRQQSDIELAKEYWAKYRVSISRLRETEK